MMLFPITFMMNLTINLINRPYHKYEKNIYHSLYSGVSKNYYGTASYIWKFAEDVGVHIVIIDGDSCNNFKVLHPHPMFTFLLGEFFIFKVRLDTTKN